VKLELREGLVRVDNSDLQIHKSNGAGVCFLGPAELAGLIRARELSTEETMAACLEQIGRTNPRVNAIVTLVPERAMRDARAADERLAEALAWGMMSARSMACRWPTRTWHRPGELVPRSAPSSTKTSSLMRTPSSSSACDAPAP